MPTPGSLALGTTCLSLPTKRGVGAARACASASRLGAYRLSRGSEIRFWRGI